MVELKCVCGCIEGYHAYDERIGWHCGWCGIQCNQGFKLDNLKLIEDLAKERKLV